MTDRIGTYGIDTRRFNAEPIATHSFAAAIGATIGYGKTAFGNTLSFSAGSVIAVVILACLRSFTKGHFRCEDSENMRRLHRRVLGAALNDPGDFGSWILCRPRDLRFSHAGLQRRRRVHVISQRRSIWVATIDPRHRTSSVDRLQSVAT